ncbi:MAG: hypothetical protein Q8S73_44665 [Deltaproteobacteria bacterium]|nr:hypothetical protein [Deltaproteobacteria bacterium]
MEALRWGECSVTGIAKVDAVTGEGGVSKDDVEGVFERRRRLRPAGLPVATVQPR